MIKVKTWGLLVLLASLIAMALSWVATPVIRTTLYFGRAWMASHMTPNPSADGRRFHPLEFRWVHGALNLADTTFAIFFMMATTAFMIRHFDFTTALTHLRHTVTTITEATGLSPHTTPRHGNERSSPDGILLSGARPDKSPHLLLPASA